jgi:hypothetical protein
METELIPENDGIVRYLFHELSEPEVEEFQRRLLFDDDLFERLQLQEMNLIHSFVRDEMTDEEQIRFRTHFLVFKQNQEKVRDARLFHESLRSIQAQRSRKVGPAIPSLIPAIPSLTYKLTTPRALAFVSLVLIVPIALGIVIFWTRHRASSNQQPVITNSTNSNQITGSQQSTANVGNANPGPPLSQESSTQPKSRPKVHSQEFDHVKQIDLASRRTPRNTMGPSEETIIDNPNAKSLFRFRLRLGNDRYDKYFVTIEDVDLGEIEGLGHLEAKEKTAGMLIVDISASYFKEGHTYRYILDNNKRAYKMLIKRNPPSRRKE